MGRGVQPHSSLCVLQNRLQLRRQRASACHLLSACLRSARSLLAHPGVQNLVQLRRTEGLGVLMGARVVEKIDSNTQVGSCIDNLVACGNDLASCACFVSVHLSWFRCISVARMGGAGRLRHAGFLWQLPLLVCKGFQACRAAHTRSTCQAAMLTLQPLHTLRLSLHMRSTFPLQVITQRWKAAGALGG